MTEFKIVEVFKSPDDGERFATITLSNTDIKNIKASLAKYEGDKDDTKNKIKMEKLKQNIHEVWKDLNPS